MAVHDNAGAGPRGPGGAGPGADGAKSTPAEKKKKKKAWTRRLQTRTCPLSGRSGPR